MKFITGIKNQIHAASNIVHYIAPILVIKAVNGVVEICNSSFYVSRYFSEPLMKFLILLIPFGRAAASSNSRKQQQKPSSLHAANCTVRILS